MQGKGTRCAGVLSKRGATSPVFPVVALAGPGWPWLALAGPGWASAALRHCSRGLPHRQLQGAATGL